LRQVEEERTELNAINLSTGWIDTRKSWSELSEESKRLSIYVLRYGSFSAACRLAAEHRAHTLARSQLDEEVIRAILELPTTDVRQINLQKLAALHVPTITGINNAVALRKSSADFAEWRNRLGEALTYVGELGEDEDSLDGAAEVVYAQLSGWIEPCAEGGQEVARASGCESWAKCVRDQWNLRDYRRSHDQ
jgi:hypothetical protein